MFPALTALQSKCLSSSGWLARTRLISSAMAQLRGTFKRTSAPHYFDDYIHASIVPAGMVQAKRECRLRSENCAYVAEELNNYS